MIMPGEVEKAVNERARRLLAKRNVKPFCLAPDIPGTEKHVAPILGIENVSLLKRERQHIGRRIFPPVLTVERSHALATDQVNTDAPIRFFACHERRAHKARDPLLPWCTDVSSAIHSAMHTAKKPRLWRLYSWITHPQSSPSWSE